jgi:uncharacterized protein (TIGR03435 family)
VVAHTLVARKRPPRLRPLRLASPKFSFCRSHPSSRGGEYASLKHSGETILIKIACLTSLAGLVIAIPIFSQKPDAPRPSFEVATIKPNTSAELRIAILAQPGGRFIATGVSLRLLMGYAYGVRDFQISGGPSWVPSDRWDITARAEEGSIPPGPRDPNTPDPLALRTQSLLEDRFQLKFHRETKELPVYELTVAKGGTKLHLSEDQNPLRPPERGDPPFQRGGPMPRGNMRMGRGSLEATAVPIANFVRAMSQQLGRTVMDKTGLTGLYDIKLEWTPDPIQGGAFPLPAGVEPPAPDPSGPSIFTAIQDQLGLKLDGSKGAVEVLVIDSVQKPVEN